MKYAMKFATENSAGYIALDYDRPALTGSEKQIAWAEKIRATTERELIDIMVRGYKLRVGIYLTRDDPAIYAPIIDKLNASLLTTYAGATFEQRVTALFANTAAKFWIEDVRLGDLEALLTKAA